MIIITFVMLGLGWFVLRPMLRHHIPHRAPAIAARQLDGTPFVLANMQGRTVVLDFFATWCEPCMQALPYVEAFAAASPGVLVVAVDEGESREVVEAFAKRHRLKHVLLDQDNAIANRYGVNGFPTLIGIDGNGFVRNRWYGFSPRIGDQMQAATDSYAGLRRAKNDASPARPL